jgi:hypothetical protein
VPKAGTESLMELLHILAQLNNYTAAADDTELKAKRYKSYSITFAKMSLFTFRLAFLIEIDIHTN